MTLNSNAYILKSRLQMAKAAVLPSPAFVVFDHFSLWRFQWQNALPGQLSILV